MATASSSQILAGGQVDLGRIAGDDHLAAPSPILVRNIFICIDGVLRLIENDHGVRQGASAHEGERDLDHAGGKPALDPLRRQHVVESIVKRAQIGIDLLAHVAGKEAEPLSSLDRRPRQDQPVAFAAFHARRGEGDGEVGLAGAGGAGGEDEVVRLQGQR